MTWRGKTQKPDKGCYPELVAQPSWPRGCGVLDALPQASLRKTHKYQNQRMNRARDPWGNDQNIDLQSSADRATYTTGACPLEGLPFTWLHMSDNHVLSLTTLP